MPSCPICASDGLEPIFHYDKPPVGETDFGIENYDRDVLSCFRCGHFVNDGIEGIYENGYVDATYGNGLRAEFDRIMALPPEKSDNEQRVKRVNDYLEPSTLLDVGSGLAVFPARMKQEGWQVLALDPDPRAARHGSRVVGASVCTDFMDMQPPSDWRSQAGRFGLITFNKVLEHVRNPVEMLKRAKRFLRDDGVVYVEVPDVLAAQDGPGREEFFIEHLHVFSAESLEITAHRAGFEITRLEQVRDPSGKYTLAAFMKGNE